MIGMALFVDNLERIKYDIPKVIENWTPLADKIFLFSGSSTTTSILKGMFIEDSHLEIVELGIRINVPRDIPNATDTSVRYCYDHGVTDLIFCHADMYATSKCIEIISQYIQKHEPVKIVFEHVQLYQKMWTVFGGLIVQYKDHPIFCPEGIGHFANLKDDYCTLLWDTSLVLELGYLTISQYRNKMYSHNFIWPDAYKVNVCAAFDKNIDDGLHMAYNAIKAYKKEGILVPVDPFLYGNLFDHYKVWDEYEHCIKIMHEVG